MCRLVCGVGVLRCGLGGGVEFPRTNFQISSRGQDSKSKRENERVGRWGWWVVRLGWCGWGGAGEELVAEARGLEGARRNALPCRESFAAGVVQGRS